MEKLSNLLLENDDYLLNSLIEKLEDYIGIDEIIIDIYKKNYEYVDYNDEMEYKLDIIDGKNVVVPNLDLSKYKKEINPIRKIKSLSDLRRFVIRYQDIIIENILQKHKNFKPSIITLGGRDVIGNVKNNEVIDDIFNFLLKDDDELKTSVEKEYKNEVNKKLEDVKSNIVSKIDGLGENKDRIDEKLKKDGIVLGKNTDLKKYKEYLAFISKLDNEAFYDNNFSFHFFYSLYKELDSYNIKNSINIINNFYKNLNSEELMYFYKTHFLKHFIYINIDNIENEQIYALIRYFSKIQKKYSHEIFFLKNFCQINFVLENKELVEYFLESGIAYDIRGLFGIHDKKLLEIIDELGTNNFINKFKEKDTNFINNLFSFLEGDLKIGFFKKRILTDTSEFIKKYT